jgi:hypothetical protein
MEHDPQEALSVFAAAISQLLQRDDIAQADPGERALVGELPALLAGRFPGWSVNIEWDRYEQEVKRLRYRLDDIDFEREAPIVPDLIIHRVGKKENLLVVEVKRAINRNFKRDIWKLRGMTDKSGDYAYAAGLHLIIDVPGRKVENCDVYVDGKIEVELTNWLRERLP